MDTNQIILDRSLLKPQLQNLTPEKIINILNDFVHETAPPPKIEKIAFTLGREAEEKLTIKDFESRKPGPHSGDLLIWKKDFPDIVIMIVMKNYTNAVPAEQYEKFIRDLELNRFTGGIFVANKPITGFSEQSVQSNKIILTSHDSKLVQLACDTLWLKLYENSRFGLLDSDILHQSRTLASGLETLVRVKSTIENMRKYIKKNSALLLHDIDRYIFESREIIKNIVLNFKPHRNTFTAAPLRLPEMMLFDFKTALERFFNSDEFLRGLNREQIYVSEEKNTVQYAFSPSKTQSVFEEKDTSLRDVSCKSLKINEESTKKIKLTIFKTKVEISFKPSNYNFQGVEYLNYSEGSVIFILTKKNIESCIYESILRFW